MKRFLSPLPLAGVIGVAALLALLVYAVAQNGSSHSIDDALARGERPTAPSVALPRLGAPGKSSLAAYRGRVVVLNFWASWCDPCKSESPLLERWHRRIAPQGGTVLGIDEQDVESDATAFARRYGLTYPSLRDGPGARQKEFGVTGVPETLVIDRRGRIASTDRGPVDDAFFRQRVLPLLKEPA
jgi:cytochrome c biogenesis protein CcmG/thiol:disulfide interchange protein DsbE